MKQRPITSLSLKNFRGFVGEHSIDLDADLILISGKNGVGKTSILLALDVLLNGRTNLIDDMGDLLSSGHSEGIVSLDGVIPRQISLSQPREPKLHANLLERAQFFFPEGLVSPENSQDILSIVAPTSKISDEIKRALEVAQQELAHARTTMLVRGFDVEGARRQVAQQFELARNAFPEEPLNGEPWGQRIRDSQSLLIQGGNLANHWQSQLRNLLDTMRAHISDDVVFGESPSELLESISRACEKLRKEMEDSPAPVHAPGFPSPQLLSSLERAPEHTKLEWFSTGDSDASTSDASNLVVSPNTDGDDSDATQIAALEGESMTLRTELNIVRNGRSEIELSEDSLRAFLGDFPERADAWISNLQRLPERACPIGSPIEKWLADTVARVSNISEQVETIALVLREMELETGQRLSLIENELKLLQDRLWLRKALRPLANEQWATEASTVGELAARADTILSARHQTTTVLSRYLRSLEHLSKAAATWADTEREIERELSKAATSGDTVRAEKILTEAEKTLKRALGKESIFSLTSAIDEGQLRDLLLSLNRLLARFHFPTEFLPIQLQAISSRAKVPSYQFASANGPVYRGLSTGQRTQLAVCWSVCLSYALRDRISHPIIAFDDFTTALDMGQLIPAAGILRQLAYTDSEEYYRQVIVTSHHEDLTNRLIDYLLPPAGKTMKVIEMLEWTPARGPSMRLYDARVPGSHFTPSAKLGDWLNAQLGSRLV